MKPTVRIKLNGEVVNKYYDTWSQIKLKIHKGFTNAFSALNRHMYLLLISFTKIILVLNIKYVNHKYVHLK